MSCRPLLITLCCLSLLLGGCDLLGTTEEPRERPQVNLSSQEKHVVASKGAFGLKLFRALSEEQLGDNVFISPLSVSMALGMTLNGAEGKTREDMKETLELAGLSEKEINESYRDLTNLLQELDPRVTFRIANSIWYREGFHAKPAFIETNKEHFDARVEDLDFTSPDAVDIINGWVEDKTNGKITELVKRLTSEDRMALVNAMYFKADWRFQFDEAKTEKAPFTLPDGSTTDVEMMTLEEPTMAYHREEDLVAVDVPYGDSLFVMTVLLPERGENVDSLARSLTPARWNEITAAMKSRRLGELRLPKFKLEYEKELSKVLTDLGMGIAFTKEANFNGMSDTPLAITVVRHKTFLEVDEKGTEATAATLVKMGIVSVIPNPVVRVNRPFILAIREVETGSVLFIGKVTDPTACCG